MGDHTDVVQEEPPGLQGLTKIWATCVVVDVSKCLDILTLEVSAILERLSFLLECGLCIFDIPRRLSFLFLCFQKDLFFALHLV